jgi:hypothetical protein
VVDEGRMLSSAEGSVSAACSVTRTACPEFHRTLRLLDDPNKKIRARLSPIPPERLPHNPRSGHMDLDEVIEQYHEALEKFSRGDPEPVKRLYSHRGDVVLANPIPSVPPCAAGTRHPRRWSMPRPGFAMGKSRPLKKWRGMRAPIWW